MNMKESPVAVEMAAKKGTSVAGGAEEMAVKKGTT